MKFPWFKQFGIVFIPANVAGWGILLAGLVYSVYLFIDIDSRSHSVSDTLMNFVFNLFLLWIAYSVLAFLTSFRPKRKGRSD